MIQTVVNKFTASNVIYDSENGYTYTYNHNLGTLNLLVSIIDNNGNLFNSSDVFTITENKITVSLGNNNFEGTYTITIYYEDGSEYGQTLTQKRLFEQPLVSDLENYIDYRIAIGKQGFPTQNITISDFRSSIVASNLPYLSTDPSNWQFTTADAANARAKIGSPSTVYVNNLFSQCTPLQGLVISVSSFVSTGAITTDPVINSVICTSGIQMSINLSLLQDECNGFTKLGSFTSTGITSIPISAPATVYNPAYISTGTTMRGTCLMRFDNTVNAETNTITTDFYVNNARLHSYNNMTGLGTIFLPIYYNE